MSDYGLWFIAMLGGALIGWGFRGLAEHKSRLKDAKEITGLYEEVCRLKLLIRLGSKGDE